MAFKSIDRARLSRLWAIADLSVADISAVMDVSPASLHRLAAEMALPRRRRGRRPRHIAPDEAALLASLRADGVRVADIAQIMGKRSPGSISKAARAAGLPSRWSRSWGAGTGS